MASPATAALVFLVCVFPIALYVAWSDMKFMKIPNRSVYALVAVFAVVGIFVLPFEDWAWRWLHLVVALVVTFALNMLRLMGGGDAKFIAAMAPFIAYGDGLKMLFVFPIALLAAFVGHRLCRAIPAVRAATPDWASWTSGYLFPMGLALSGTLLLYLALAAVYGT